MKYRVYDKNHTPIEGGKVNEDYWNCGTQIMAIKLTILLNKTTNRSWVWA